MPQQIIIDFDNNVKILETGPQGPPGTGPYTKGFISHGSNPNLPRPVGFASVEWYGSVEPVNWIDGDTWIDPEIEEGA